MRLLHIGVIAVSVATFLACTDNPSKQQAGVQDFPNTLQASAREALFDLPSSVQAAQPSVQADSGVVALAKTLALTLDAQEREAFGPYLAVPVYIHIAETAKQSVQQFIEDLATKNLPPHWQGKVDSLDITTLLVDSTIEGRAATYCSVKAERNGDLRLRLTFFRTDSAQYQGSFYLSEPAKDSSRIRVRFNSIGTGGESRMSVMFQRSPLNMEKVNDPTLLRVQAIKRANGRMVITGASYHPAFVDSFWGNGPKVYGFQAVSDPSLDRSVLRIAFADADSVDSTFYTSHSLDKGVLHHATLSLRKTMHDSTSWTKVIYFCLDSGLSIQEAMATHFRELYAYVPTRTADDFRDADLERYLDLNQADILARKPGTEGLRGLYLMIKIKPPIFLARNATIVGAGLAGLPTGFPLPATAIEDESVDNQAPIGLADSVVTGD